MSTSRTRIQALRLLAAALIALCGGCDSRTAGSSSAEEAASFQGLAVTGISIKGLTDLDDERLERFKASVKERLGEELEGDIRLTDAGGVEAPATLTFELLPDPERPGRVLFHLAFTLSGRDDHGRFKLLAEFSEVLSDAPEGGPTDAQLDALAERASGALARDLELQASALMAGDAELEDSLTASNPARILYAVREVGRRQSESHRDAIRALLVHPETDIVLASAAVLAAQRDADAVGALVDLTTSSNPEKVRSAVYALGSIGGEDAENHLRQLVSRHPNPLIRRLAEEGLLTIQRRKD